ncbi:HAMP domain-containing histidine kinase [Alteromonas pelagimontana]|uniref:histidine kinase n=1 Tax=Alteromonas pelagimontana TaxID=1858656 RepID=A0A6M4MB34_9ALTE|nr:HAMP domain-containing sensor histidine kinase [Alteromonas pelagimontana]QJR79830.1 HAMP domain-containing histidine kinase [Alteromonas pelagimontana]
MQLGSLRQLTVGSFVLALVPLIALLWQSQNDLAKVGQMASVETRYVVNVVGLMQQLDGAAIDLERTLRQYAIIQNDTVAELTDSALRQFVDAKEDLCSTIAGSETCSLLDKQIAQLKNFRSIQDQLLLNAYLASLGSGVSAMRGDVEKAIQQRLAIQQDDLNAMQAKQAWSTAMLVSVSLLLILLGSQLIVNPVKKLKQIIRILAQQQGELPPLSTQAPKELIGVERDLHWLAERLQQLEHIRTALLRHAAHELKTPLASIKEGCSLLSENVVGHLNPQQAEVLTLLSSSTQRLNTLVEKLLDYNLLLQQAQPTFSDVNPHQMVKDCLGDYALALQEREVTVDIKVASIYVDEELYRRILDNLISNAVAHGAVGRPINMTIYNKGKNTILDVANRGKRIPQEKVAKLFEPFTRGDDPRNDNVIGTGLGLSIVSDCARLMHGDVAVVDVDYADVCFRVAIPQKENFNE